MAKQNPDDAISAMTKILVDKFQPAVIRKACAVWLEEPEAQWPTAGEFISLCLECATKPGDKAKKARVAGQSDITDFRNVRGYTFQQVMHSKEGRRAIAQGRPHSFLKDVTEGTIQVESLTFTI